MKTNIRINTIIVSLCSLLSGFTALAATYDVGSGTVTVPDEFVFKHTGTKDSFRGTLTRTSDGMTIYFDIGHMAGTHMHDGMKGKCTYFSKHSIGGLPAITGIEVIPDGKRIVTTAGYDPKIGGDPANFYTAIRKESDIADFLLIAITYQAKKQPIQTGAKKPELGDDKIYTGATRVGLNGEVPLDLVAAKDLGAKKAAADIKVGKFRIHEYGQPRPITEDTKDEQTGYQIESVAGCKVPETVRAEADAYNQAMRDWHAKNPPKPKR